MNKKVWIEIDKWDKSLITDALENGVDAFFVTKKEYVEKIKALAKVDVFEKNSLPNNIQFFKINSKEDEERAAKISNKTSLIIEAGDWKIIPFENLIAVRENLFAAVNNIDDALESLGILEKGVDGLYVNNCSSMEKINILKKIKLTKGNLKLEEGEIISVTKLISGDRICIDTITNMVNGS